MFLRSGISLEVRSSGLNGNDETCSHEGITFHIFPTREVLLELHFIKLGFDFAVPQPQSVEITIVRYL